MTAARRCQPAEQRPSQPGRTATLRSTAMLLAAAQVAQQRVSEKVLHAALRTNGQTNISQTNPPLFKSVALEKKTYTKPTIPRTANAPRSRFLAGQDRLQRPIGMFDGSRPVGVRNDLGAAGTRRAVRVVGWRSGRVEACRRRLGRRVPLRHARGQLHKVVLSADGVPLGDPAGGQRRGRKGWARGGTGGCGSRHYLLRLSVGVSLPVSAVLRRRKIRRGSVGLGLDVWWSCGWWWKAGLEVWKCAGGPLVQMAGYCSGAKDNFPLPICAPKQRGGGGLLQDVGGERDTDKLRPVPTVQEEKSEREENFSRPIGSSKPSVETNKDKEMPFSS